MKSSVAVGLTIVSVVAVSASGLAAGRFLSGGGSAGPEEALPDTTVAFVKLDLNPSVGQKINLLRLSSKLPDVKVPHDDLKGAILREALDGNDLGLDYAKDVEPWIGDQVAVAEVAGPAAHQGTATILAVEFTDRAKMEAALDHAKSKLPGSPRTAGTSPVPAPSPPVTPTPGARVDCFTVGPNTAPGTNPSGTISVQPNIQPTPQPSYTGTLPPRPTRCFTTTPTPVPTLAAGPTSPSEPAAASRPAPRLAYAVRGSYVLIGEDRAAVDRAATSARSLSDVPAYVADADEIDAGGQLLTGWADVGAAYDAGTRYDRKDLLGAFGAKTRPTGTIVGGIHAEPSYLEADLATHGLRFLDEVFPVSPSHGTGMVDTLPADTSVAFEAADLGAAATRMWDRLGRADDLFGIDDAARSAGVRLPEDLQAVLGEDYVAGARFLPDRNSGFDLATRARTDRADRALAVAKILTRGEPDAHGQRTPDGYVWGTHGEVYRQLLSGQSGLGQDPSFRTAVEDPDHADAVLFVRIHDLLAVFGSESDGKHSWDALDAFGVSASGTPADGKLVARLSVR